MLAGRIRLIIQNIKRKYNYFQLNTNFSPSTLIVSIVSIIIILFLLVNIVNVVSVGLQNYKIIAEQQQKLDQVKNVNEALKEELKYKQSDEYVMKQALKELNLAMQGSTIYNIESTNKDIPYFEAAKEFQTKPTVQRDRMKEWWELFMK